MGWASVAGGLGVIRAAHSTSSSSPHEPPPSSPPKRVKINVSQPARPKMALQKQKPSVSEMQRAIGIGDDPLRGPSSSSDSFMDMLANTPIGQAEGSVERKIREASEWMVDRTETHSSSGIGDDPLRGPSSSSDSFIDMLANAPIGQAKGRLRGRSRRLLSGWSTTPRLSRSGQQILLVVCLNILPVWLLLLLVASGVIKLPSDIPFIDDLFG